MEWLKGLPILLFLIVILLYFIEDLDETYKKDKGK